MPEGGNPFFKKLPPLCHWDWGLVGPDPHEGGTGRENDVLVAVPIEIRRIDLRGTYYAARLPYLPL